jgi:hypothetical protein
LKEGRGGGCGDGGAGCGAEGECWRWEASLTCGAGLAAREERKKGKEKGLTSGPHVAVTEKKEKGERGRCWAAAAELGQKRKLGRGRKEAAWAWFCFFFQILFKSFSNPF